MINSLEIDKSVGLKTLEKDVEKFKKLISKIDGKNTVSIFDRDEYFELWFNFEYRNLFDFKGYLNEKIIVKNNGDYFDMDLKKAIDVFADWTEIFYAVEECFGKYFK